MAGGAAGNIVIQISGRITRLELPPTPKISPPAVAGAHPGVGFPVGITAIFLQNDAGAQLRIAIPAAGRVAGGVIDRLYLTHSFILSDLPESFGGAKAIELHIDLVNGDAAQAIEQTIIWEEE